MATTNDVTGDLIKTKPNSKQYRDNWDKIFKKKEKESHPDQKGDGADVDNAMDK